MEYGEVERVLRGCVVEMDDDDAVRGHKRQRRQRAERDLDDLLQLKAPTANEAYGLAEVLSWAGPGDVSTLKRARDMAHLAHTRGHPEAGRLFARCVDRLLYAEHKSQRYGTSGPQSRVRLGCRRWTRPSPTTSAQASGCLPLPRWRRGGGGQPPGRPPRRRPRFARRGEPPSGFSPWVPAQLEQGRGGHDEAVWRDGPDLVFCRRGSASAVTA